jgi:diguanylate cyclase (GGDEF)-like protein
VELSRRPADAEPPTASDARGRRRRRSALLSIGVGVIFGALAPLMRDAWSDARAIAIGSALSAMIGTWLLIRFAFEPLHRKVEDRETALRKETGRQEFGVRLNRALERSRTETDVLRVTMRAVESVNPELPAEALIADSSRAHLRRQASTAAGASGDAARAGCPVVSPWDCPAMSSSAAQYFPDSDELDACQFLRDRAEASGKRLTALCLPMSSRGQAVGVLHAVTTTDAPIVADEQSLLATIASRTGVTIGANRAFAKSQLQASTDPLTGLLNRRSFEERAATVLDGASRFALIMADLDNFKTLNDLHGHSAGDRALRRFAEVLRGVAGPGGDEAGILVARVGGEEFLILLPNASADDGVELAQRLRVELRRSGTGPEPVFTVSLGVAQGSRIDDLGSVIGAADRALFAAKAAGRDRVVSADGPAAASSAPSAAAQPYGGVPVQRRAEHTGAADGSRIPL